MAEFLSKNCHTLQCLWIGDNRIQKFPTRLLGLKNLQSLHLNENQICEIPRQLAFMTSLQHLNLDHNKLTGLPDTLYFSGIKRLPGPRFGSL